MSIDRINISNHGIENHRAIDRSQEAKGREQAGKNTPAAVPGSTEDSVALSSKAREIGRLSELAGQNADRTEHLNRVRAAIDNGTYRVSGEDIARKMIEAHQK